MTPSPTLLDAALTAATRGWRVHPLRPGGKASALHGERACPHIGECAADHVKWEQRATTDPDRIRAAWTAGTFNVGIAPGPSGLVVIDLDVPKEEKRKGSSAAPDGATSFSALCERAEVPWPTTYTVRTPSGGLHLYFATPPDIRLHSTARTVAPNMDTRAWGGNVVAAGSSTPQGAYIVTDDVPAAVLPTWLLHHLQTPPPPIVAAAPLLIPGQATRRATAALERETAAVRGTSEGGRNNRLLAGARSLGRFVAWGEIPRDAVEEAFQAAGETAGLPTAECRTTIRSALDWSIRTCRPREAV
ncbi:bifunctional DNA primase/polymerase [Streptomyces cylindrosporus]|uniref:Bifunctional DNA primase/polymerase n=1 Tax=Streptomyces cylindrosporus TaxID=2927583 RepID=A0ABS9YGC8_9ACTN|nr:bifunctional DNA primase/polymerase [Streptomyces cylindrosporus]MCI3276290.1 bifunctional DNA primase/polymerase [Streptomyces cylindrosporus]